MPSAKILENKKAQVKELVAKLSDAKIAVLVEYKGVTVEDDRSLRKSFREAGIDYMVVKNSIIKLAAKEVNIEGFEGLEGPTAVLIGKEDYTSSPKIVYDFAKTHDFYKFKGGVMDGKRIEVEELMKLAKLPSREVLLTQLASALIGNIRNLAVVIDQVAKSKEEVVSA